MKSSKVTRNMPKKNSISHNTWDLVKNSFLFKRNSSVREDIQEIMAYAKEMIAGAVVIYGSKESKVHP